MPPASARLCPHCRIDKPAVDFYRNRNRSDGLSILCKLCFRAYEGLPDRRAKRTWHTINARVRRQSSYAGVEIRMTRAEFLAWALPAFTEWMGANPNKTPSVDRRDPSGHYEVGNLRILERGENGRLARNHPNVHAPDGLAWCHRCKSYRPVAAFQRCRSNFNGLQKRCRSCQNAASRLR
jgi:hypothetical protein